MEKTSLLIVGLLILLLAHIQAKAKNGEDLPSKDQTHVADDVIQDVFQADLPSKNTPEVKNDPLPFHGPDMWQEQNQYYWIKTNGISAACSFTGYKPNGPITSPEKITPPKATLLGQAALSGILKGAGGKISKAAAGTMHTIKLSDTLTAAAGKLAPALGLLSVLAGSVAGSSLTGTKPSAQDILDGVNQAIGELTSEVNRKLDHMTGYVDESILRTEKNLIANQFKSVWRLWARCVKHPQQDITIRCQRNAIDHLISKRHEYMPYANCLTGSECGTRANRDKKVRKLEAYMLLFRDYANLAVMELSLLVEYYCFSNKDAPNADFYCKRYSDEMEKEATFFIKYATEAISYINVGHLGHRPVSENLCTKTFVCGAQKERQSGSFSWNVKKWSTGKCWCQIMKSNIKKYCEVSYSISRKKAMIGYSRYQFWYKDGKGLRRNSWNTAGRFFGKLALFPKAENYQRSLVAIMKKYWQQEVLDFVPQWRSAIKIAVDMRNGNFIPKRVVPGKLYSKQRIGTCSVKLTLAECRDVMAPILGKTFQESFSGSTQPYGCYLWTDENSSDHGLFFNTNEASTASCTAERECQCKIHGLVYSKKQTERCNFELTLAECRDVMAPLLGKTFQESFSGSKQPYGCYLWTDENSSDHGLFFNTNEASTASCTAERECQCKKPDKIKLVNAEQSSTKRGKGASLAIGGSRSVSMTADNSDPNPWWKAELTEPREVTNVKLILPPGFIRKGYYKGLTVQIGKGSNGPWVDCASDIEVIVPTRGPINHRFDVKCSSNSAMKFLKISATGGEPLVLRDVKVYGF